MKHDTNNSASDSGPTSSKEAAKARKNYDRALDPAVADKALTDEEYLRRQAERAKLAIAHNNMAWALLGSGGQEKPAVESAKKAVSLSPKSAPFVDTLGWAERAAGDLNAARTSLKRALELDPKVAVFHYHYGVVMSELKDDKAAAASFKTALKLDPQFEDASDALRRLKLLGA